MAEAMTVETIVEAEWQAHGYWTKIRYPFQTLKGGWSDVDLLAFHPEDRHLVIAESKVRGPKKAVYAYTAETRKKWKTILKYDNGDYFPFLENLKLLFRPEPEGVFKDFKGTVKKLTVQLVSNYYIDDNEKPEAVQTILDRVRKNLPSGLRSGIDLKVQLDSTLEVILRILKWENTHTQGRRYGHPMLDIARELNRYLHPDIKYAAGAKASKRVSAEIWSKIDHALRVTPG